MKGKKVLKIVLIVALVLIALFLANTIRKVIILKDLKDKISKYEFSNFHLSINSEYDYDGHKSKLDYYKKDNKELSIMELEINGSKSKVSWYNNGERIDTFYEGADFKNVEIDSENMTRIYPFSIFEGTLGGDNDLFIKSISLKINSTKINDKDCYLMRLGEEKYYFEKDTGLVIYVEAQNAKSNRIYEFNTITDEIFTEPDISQYTLIKK